MTGGDWFALGLFAIGLIAGGCFGCMWGIRQRAAAFVKGLEQAKAIYKRQLEDERLMHAREKAMLVRFPPPPPEAIAALQRAIAAEPAPPLYHCAHGALPEPCKICAPWLRGIADMPVAKQ